MVKMLHDLTTSSILPKPLIKVLVSNGMQDLHPVSVVGIVDMVLGRYFLAGYLAAIELTEWPSNTTQFFHKPLVKEPP